MNRFKAKWLLVLFAVLLVTMPFLAACNSETSTPPTNNTPTSATAKYVFLFIGDGMGISQRNSAEIFLSSTNGGEESSQTRLIMNQLPAQGMSTTYAANAVITDSAAAATAIACGYKTNSGVIAMDTTKTKTYKTIGEMAKEKGMKVGIISSVSIDHATPACFYAHQPTRNNYYEIDMELASSSFDYFAGGGLKSPKGKDGNQSDAIAAARANRFTVVDNHADFEKLSPGVGKVLATSRMLDSSKAMYYELDRPRDSISLAEFTRKGIELLDNPKGFLMMVEGGKIDWACHANDAAASIWDTLAFDAAVAEAVKFWAKHPEETLIVITGDHECGGMTIGFAGTKYSSFFNKIQHQTMSYIEFNKEMAVYKETCNPATACLEDVFPLIKAAFGLEIGMGDMALTEYEIEQLRDSLTISLLGKEARAKDDATYLLYGGYEPFTVTLTHILNQKAGIGWTTYSHTGVPVPVSAIGAGQELFNGYYDNTDIAKKIMAIARLN